MQPRHPHCYPHLLRKALPIALGLVLANSASAAEWTNSAGVAPAVMYTDNVCLSQDNEKGEWIGLLTPDISISGEGRNANLNLNAAVEMNTLSDSRLDNLGCNGQGFFGDRKQFAPRIDGNADAVLLEDWFFIDANANADQNEVTPYASGGGDSLNRTGNTNTYYRYAVSPYVARRFKDVADLMLRYTWDEQFNTENVVEDSTEQNVLFTLGNNPEVSALSWGIEGNYTKVKYDDSFDGVGDGFFSRGNNNSELKSAQLNLGYQLNRDWQVNGFYGEDWNDFDTISRDDIDGDYWDVGLRWTPNERTTVEAGTGHRFFGDTPRFSISHRHKRSELSASYEKIITFGRDIRTSGGIGDSSSLDQGPTLDKRYTLNYSYEGRRSSLSVSASHSDQTTAEFLQENVYKSVSVSLNRSLSRQLSISGGLSWYDDDLKKGVLDNFDAKSETWRATLGAKHQLSTNTQLSFDYMYTDRQSDNRFDEYKENRFTLTLRVDL